MNDTDFDFDKSLIADLRSAALNGAQPVDLIRMIQQREGYSPNYVVPVLAYLCRAFCVPLQIVLPLREEMGVGPESHALRVVFWFAATMLASDDLAPWDWQVFQVTFKNGFNAEDMEPWPTVAEGTELTQCKTADGIFARGILTIIVDDQEAYDARDENIRERIRAFAEHHRQMLRQSSNGQPGEYLTRMTFEFQIHPVGPKRRILCMVQALKELVEKQPSLASA